MGKKEEIGIRIRTMRKSRGLTQEDLAKAICQSPSSITMYETGRREPDFETLEALADAFNIPISSLIPERAEYTTGSILRENDMDKPKNDDIRLLIRGLNKMPPEQIQQAKSMMRIMFAKYFDEEDDDAT